MVKRENFVSMGRSPMGEDLRKAEAKERVNVIFIFVILSSFFLSAFIIGRGSFDFFSTPIPIITFLTVLLGFFLYYFWDLGNRAFLKSDWKTLGTGRRASFSFKVYPWNICTFQGIGNRRHDYLNLVTEEMTKKGFQMTEKSPAINIKGSDLIFIHSSRVFRPDLFIRAVPVGKNLRVGFVLTGEAGPWVFLSVGLALLPTLLSMNVIKYIELQWTNVPDWMMLIPVIVYFLSLIGIMILIYGLSALRNFRQEIKPFLFRIGKSLGSKQITPFKKILVKMSS